MGPIWNKIWGIKVPSKIKHFCWKSFNNTLSTKLNLASRGIILQTMCPMCSKYPESTDHILFNCDRVRDIWRQTFDIVFLDEDFNGSFQDRWTKIYLNSSPSELGLVATTCWSIWNDRNKLVHGEDISQSSIKSKWIIDYHGNYLKANSIKSSSHGRSGHLSILQTRSRWSPRWRVFGN